MANLPFDSYSPPKSTYSSLMDTVDPLSPWSYISTYSNDANDSMNTNTHNNNNNDSLNMLQHYEMNHWAPQMPCWQAMLDDWIPPPASQHEQKPGFLDLSSLSHPPTPPNQTPTSSIGLDFLASLDPSKDIIPSLSSHSLHNTYSSAFGTADSVMFTSSASTPTIMTTPSITPSSSTSSSSSSPSSSAPSLSPPVSKLSSLPSTNGKYRRRCSEHHLPRTNRPYRRRASSHPSVASVVSLTAHEPTSKYINGVEHITFLYSHERLVREYTMCANVESVDVDAIPLVFKAQNTIYPRANVVRSKYDGNRWDYETTCNTLGWKLCWLNQTQLCGRRGLIQRAVDSYRNRHAEMHSRRVARQQKVANGTLRKRKSKKSIVSPLM